MKTKSLAFSTVNVFKIVALPVMLAMSLIFPGCNNNSGEAQKNLNDLKTFVKEHKDSVDKYVDQSVAVLDSQYTDKKARLEKDYDKLNDSMKVSFDKTKQDWNAFKDTVAKKVTLKTSANSGAVASPTHKVVPSDTLTASLVMKGLKPDFSNLAAGQTLKEYQHFVATVKEHKDTYTSDEWTAVNMVWKDLNDRSKEVGPKMTEADKKQLTKLRLEYTGIKAMNRPTSREFEGDDHPTL